MKKSKMLTIIMLVILVLTGVILAQKSEKIKSDFPVLKGLYLGQKAPGLKPEIFAPGIVSTSGGIEFALTISPDGSQIYFSRFLPMKNKVIIMVTQVKDGKWTVPEPVSFSGIHRDGEPFISPDNKRLFFSSDRPRQNSKVSQKGDLWYVNRTSTGWSDPINLGPEINTNNRQGHPTVSRKGTLYFHRISKDGYDIFQSSYVNGKYQSAVKLGKDINTNEFIEGEPFIAPDESFLIFISASRPDKIAAESKVCDLYISFRKKSGGWMPAKIMGSEILSKSEENWPRVSSDGKYLFFSSNREKTPPFPDIYWVDADVIKKLKPKKLK